MSTAVATLPEQATCTDAACLTAWSHMSLCECSCAGAGHGKGHRAHFPTTGKRADIDPFTRMATGRDDDAADAAFGATDHLDALAVQRARLHKIAVEETSPDRPRYGIGAVDEEDMF